MVEDLSQLCVAPTVDADGTVVPCLRIGAVFVGMSRESIERVLGKPWRDLGPTPPGKSTVAYLVHHDSVAGTSAYYAVEYEHLDSMEIAFSVQLTGDKLSTGEHFSCIGLGDGAEAITQQLGRPSETAAVDVGRAGVTATAWYYWTLSTSIEIVNGRVFSLRVWRPDEVLPRERTLSRLVIP